MREDTFEAFATSAAPSLLRLARALTGNEDDAWDLVQDCLIRVGTRWGRVRRDGNPAGYARTTLVRLNLDRHRRRARQIRTLRRLASEPSPEVPGPESTATGGAAGWAEESWLPEAWRDLSPHQRACLSMRYLDDCEIETIGDTLGCSQVTVRSHLSRGLERLRRRAPSHVVLAADDA